jgi:hypothetical protein
MTNPDEVRPARLPVTQPDPMLRETRAGWLRTAVTLLGGAAVVILVLYGITRPANEPQLASAPEATETAPSGGAAANAGAQAPAANAPAQNAQPNPQQPTTTGQGSAQQNSTKPSDQPQNAAGQPGPPAAGGGATGTVGGPSAKPAPQPH